MLNYEKEGNLTRGDLIIGGENNFIEKVFEEHLKERKIIFNTEVDPSAVEMLIVQIMKWNKEDKGIPIEDRKPIKLYISSCGGDIFSGLGIVDIIKNSKTPVHGIVLTIAYSMASVILVNCHVRYMLKSASVLIHDGSMMLQGSSNKAKDQMKFFEKIDEVIRDIFVQNSNITAEEYEKNADRELYLLASECKEKGVIDYIVGVDVDIDDII